MTQEEHWDAKYAEIMQFMARTGRCPSKYNPEERGLFNWMKFNKRMLNRDMMPQNRRMRFGQLLEVSKSLRRVNQYAYLNNVSDQLMLDL